MLKSLKKFMFWKWLSTASIIVYFLSMIGLAFTEKYIFLLGFLFLAIAPLAEGFQMYHAFNIWKELRGNGGVE